MTENPKTQVKLYAQAWQPLSKHKCHRADKVQIPRPDLRIVPRVRNTQSNKKRGQGQTNQHHSCHTRHWRVRTFRRAWGMRHAAHCAGCLVAVGPSPIPGGVASCVEPIHKSARGFAFRSLRLLCPFVCCLFLFCFFIFASLVQHGCTDRSHCEFCFLTFSSLHWVQRTEPLSFIGRHSEEKKTWYIMVSIFIYGAESGHYNAIETFRIHRLFSTSGVSASYGCLAISILAPRHNGRDPMRTVRLNPYYTVRTQVWPHSLGKQVQLPERQWPVVVQDDSDIFHFGGRRPLRDLMPRDGVVGRCVSFSIWKAPDLDNPAFQVLPVPNPGAWPALSKKVQLHCLSIRGHETHCKGEFMWPSCSPLTKRKAPLRGTSCKTSETLVELSEKHARQRVECRLHCK